MGGGLYIPTICIAAYLVQSSHKVSEDRIDGLGSKQNLASLGKLRDSQIFQDRRELKCEGISPTPVPSDKIKRLGVTNNKLGAEGPEGGGAQNVADVRFVQVTTSTKCYPNFTFN